MALVEVPGAGKRDEKMRAEIKRVAVKTAAIALIGCFVGGCESIQQWYADQQVKWRESRQKEYQELSKLPPCQPIASPDKKIAALGKLSSELLNVTVPMMRAYVTQVEVSREYTGYINDIQYLITEKKVDSKEACAQVTREVMEADKSLPEEEKIWPKIKKGILAAKTLGTQEGHKRILQIEDRRITIASDVGKIQSALYKLQKAMKHEKNKQVKEAKMKEIDARLSECAAIDGQLHTVWKCVSFMLDQWDRTQELEEYSR